MLPYRTRSPKLNTCYLKAVRGKEFIAHHREISRQKWTVFGRSKESCDVQLLHGSVSRHHAALGHGESGNIYLVDLGSTHGTFLNGQRIEPNRRMVLADGDQLRFGESTRNYVVRLVDPRLVERNATTVEEALKESGEALKEEAEVEGGKVAPSRKRPAGPEERVRCRHVLIKHCESRRPTSHKACIFTFTSISLKKIISVKININCKTEKLSKI